MCVCAWVRVCGANSADTKVNSGNSAQIAGSVQWTRLASWCSWKLASGPTNTSLSTAIDAIEHMQNGVNCCQLFVCHRLPCRMSPRVGVCDVCSRLPLPFVNTLAPNAYNACRCRRCCLSVRSLTSITNMRMSIRWAFGAVGMVGILVLLVYQ